MSARRNGTGGEGATRIAKYLSDGTRRVRRCPRLGRQLQLTRWYVQKADPSHHKADLVDCDTASSSNDGRNFTFSHNELIDIAQHRRVRATTTKRQATLNLTRFERALESPHQQSPNEGHPLRTRPWQSEMDLRYLEVKFERRLSVQATRCMRDLAEMEGAAHAPQNPNVFPWELSVPPALW